VKKRRQKLHQTNNQQIEKGKKKRGQRPNNNKRRVRHTDGMKQHCKARVKHNPNKIAGCEKKGERRREQWDKSGQRIDKWDKSENNLHNKRHIKKHTQRVGESENNNDNTQRRKK